MDRGAARSRKRADQEQKAAPGGPSTSKSQACVPDQGKVDGENVSQQKERPKRRIRLDPSQQSKDPSLYKPKAVRTSAALVYSESPFDLPPPVEALKSVRRLDLCGSGIQDVTWLDGLAVTWLNLADCIIQEGWDAVGSLSELTVLNISGCELRQLPPSLKNLTNLKALVAMNNPWVEMDQDIVASWPNLNSLIVSHSPNLVSLPSSLSNLHHLAKATFSHCPQLSASSLPDLSSLPLLRDVKMNNLPKMTTLPSHLHSWGKGNMNLVGKGKGDSTQYGDGLQALDLGNCSLEYKSIAPLFGLTASKGQTHWHYLRSLTLHSNPIAATHPNYSELLQASPYLPNLQIVDARRVKERRVKGKNPEVRGDKRARERKLDKMRPSGANVASGKMRDWGGRAETQGETHKQEIEDGEGYDDLPAHPTEGKETAGRKEKEEKKIEVCLKKRKHGELRLHEVDASKDRGFAHKKNKNNPDSTPIAAASVADPTKRPQLSATQEGRTNDRRKDKSAVAGLIEVKSGEEVKIGANKRRKVLAKGQIKDAAGGVDLREVFGRKEKVSKEDGDIGLDVDEW